MDIQAENQIEAITVAFRELLDYEPKEDHILFMRLCAAHQAHPLNLEMLTIAPTKLFLDEVNGIAENFDPHTGNYKNGFWPRYAAECCGQCNHTGHTAPAAPSEPTVNRNQGNSMQAKKILLVAACVVAFLVVVGVVAGNDIEDAELQEEVYCEMVHKGHWPDYERKYHANCKDGQLVRR